MTLPYVRVTALSALLLIFAIGTVKSADAQTTPRALATTFEKYCGERTQLTDWDNQRARLLNILRRREAFLGSVDRNPFGSSLGIKGMIARLVRAIDTLLSKSRIAPADFNNDRVIDDRDLQIFSECQMLGSTPAPGSTPSSSSCTKADLDGNGKVDTADLGLYAAYRECYEVNYPIYRDRNKCLLAQ